MIPACSADSTGACTHLGSRQNQMLRGHRGREMPADVFCKVPAALGAHRPWHRCVIGAQGRSCGPLVQHWGNLVIWWCWLQVLVVLDVAYTANLCCMCAS